MFFERKCLEKGGGEEGRRERERESEVEYRLIAAMNNEEGGVPSFSF